MTEVWWRWISQVCPAVFRGIAGAFHLRFAGQALIAVQSSGSAL
ncbi:MAG TPA: hypothetical protein VIO57_17150 [Chloroflexota bacterium]